MINREATAPRRAKIVATFGPASAAPERVRALVAAGVDVARVNMAHGDHGRHGSIIRAVRDAAADAGRPIAVLVDLAGPKIRTGDLRGGSARLEEGAETRIAAGVIEGDAGRFSSSFSELAASVSPGDRILINDGEIELRVAGTEGTDVVARVVRGGVLGQQKGINLPGARLRIPSLTEKDEADLRFALEQGVDFVGLSFVRRAEDCRAARDAIRALAGRARLIAKIEKPEAVDDLDNIVDASDGVMVARGDLAVETSPEIVPILQKRIIACALAASKSAITATQMLQSMIESAQPTRAEASDVANATLDGSDALMLSGETAVGRYPVETVRMMDRIIRTAEALGRPATDTVEHEHRPRALGRQGGSYGRAIAEAAMFAADEVGSRLIVVFTASGHLARFIAALRPRQRIIALSHEDHTCRQLPLLWGVEPYPLERRSDGSDHLLAQGDRTLLRFGLAERGEKVVLMTGEIEGLAISNSMKLHRVGDLASI